MGIQVVGAVSHNENAGSATTLAVTRNGIVSGNTIVVAVTWDTGGGTSNPTVDDGTLSDSVPDQIIDATALLSQDFAFYVFVGHPGGNKTWTATWGTARAFRGIYVIELSGVDSLAPTSGYATAQAASGTTASSGNASPVADKDGFYYLSFLLASATITGSNSPFTDLLIENVVLLAGIAGYLQPTKAAVQAQWTLSATGGWAVSIMGFRPAALKYTGLPANQRAA